MFIKNIITKRNKIIIYQTGYKVIYELSQSTSYFLHTSIITKWVVIDSLPQDAIDAEKYISDILQRKLRREMKYFPQGNMPK